MAEATPPLRLTLYPGMGPHWSTARPRGARGFEYVRCVEDGPELARELNEKARESLSVPTTHLSYGRVHLSAETAQAIATILSGSQKGGSVEK